MKSAFLSIDILTYVLKTIILILYTLCIFKKIISDRKTKILNAVFTFLSIIVISGIMGFYREKYGISFCIICELVFMIIINLVNYKKGIGYTIINTLISFGISYLLMGAAVIISSIPNSVFNIENDYINLCIIILIYSLLLLIFLNIKKIKNGLIFLQEKTSDDKSEVILLNISIMILFAAMILPNGLLDAYPVVIVSIFAIIMIITIKKSLEAYYKQTLLIQDLKDTKAKLEEKEKEIKKLEIENLEIGKRSHSLAHRQKILENKVNSFAMNGEFGNELGLVDEVNKLSKDIYGKKSIVELSKTGIATIDDVLSYMQNECVSKNIEFELQINGNIHYMINHYIKEDELEILIADHVKDAIIAIEHSNNTNKGILVRIGEIDGVYGLYIYDSGIEFEKEVLENLGKKPITTHSDDGGTGMGFMNTFDTLKKYNASLIIKEIGNMSEKEYTKIVMIKFDNKGEFKIDTYK